ncbi:MAG: class I SAM-dependent methyltransferase [Betaproteobacteria bacterium]|nr:class I SAM-dependent methyltransferase [Betaproteobacteria bacterium]
MYKKDIIRQTSTSCHAVNADDGLGITGKIIWLVFNALNNRFPLSIIDNSLIQRDFKISNADLELNWNSISKNASPARALCDLFWLKLPLHFLENELGGLRAIEIGCGSGAYGFLINKILGNRVYYKGVDVKPNPVWDSYANQPNYEFLVADSTDIQVHLKNANFIFTQSALEHFEEDLTFFRAIARFVENAKHTIFQVHLIPSEYCITTFTWHGIRQYSPRNISKITNLFSNKTEKILYRLGSRQCNKVHRRWISNNRYFGGTDKREQEHAKYGEELKRAIHIDMKSPGERESCFYALVLKSSPV